MQWLKNNFPTVFRRDSWSSEFHGYNTPQDKMNAHKIAIKKRLTYKQIRELYRDNRLLRRVVNIVPKKLIQNPWKFHGSKDAVMIQEEMKRLGIMQAFRKAQTKANLFGAGFILINFSDNMPLHMPVNIRRSTKIESIAILDKNFMYPEYHLPFQKVTHYRLHGVPDYQGGLVHESRVLFFDGEETDEYTKAENQGTGESLVDQIVDAIRDLQIGHGSAARILLDFVTAIYKIKNLKSMLMAGEEKEIVKEFSKRNFLRSLANAVLIDEKNEDFEKKSTNVQGVREILSALMDWFAALTGIPKTLLFGSSPSGGLQSGDGQSEKRDWYDEVAQVFEDKWRNHAERIVSLICQINNWVVPIIELPELWSETREQKQKNKLTQAQIDAIYVKAGILMTDEVRKNRFLDDGFNYETFLDDNAIDDSMDNMNNSDGETTSDPSSDNQVMV